MVCCSGDQVHANRRRAASATFAFPFMLDGFCLQIKACVGQHASAPRCALVITNEGCAHCEVEHHLTDSVSLDFLKRARREAFHFLCT